MSEDDASGKRPLSAEAVAELFPELCNKGRPAKPNECLDLSKRGIEEIGSLPIIGTAEAPLRRLDLSENALQRLRGLDNVKSLTMLDVRGNKLAGPALVDIASLSSLKVLNASSNRIKDVPASALRAQSSSLLACVLNDNKISDITPLTNLTACNSLILSNNRISSLPATISKMKELTKLGLAHNSTLSTLPAELAGLKKLAELRLNDCSFAAVPAASIGSIPSLRMLDLGNNKIDDLALVAPLADLPRLSQLTLRGNPCVPAYNKEGKDGGEAYQSYVAAIRALCPRLTHLDNRVLPRLNPPAAAAPKASDKKGGKEREKDKKKEGGKAMAASMEGKADSGKRKRPVEEDEDDEEEDEEERKAAAPSKGRKEEAGDKMRGGEAGSKGKGREAERSSKQKGEKKDHKKKRDEGPTAKRPRREEKGKEEEEAEEEEEPIEAVVVKMKKNADRAAAASADFVKALSSATDAGNVVAGGWD